MNRDVAEAELTRIWSEVLRVPVAEIRAEDHFLSLGGDSLLLTHVMVAVNAKYFADRPDDAPGITDFLTHGTIRSLAAHLASELAPHSTEDTTAVPADTDAIAIIGMACRFPGAADVTSFWSNLCAGIESVRPLSESELLSAGVSAAEIQHAQYVRAVSFVEGVQFFDADYFGLTPREAALMSPEQRLLLECSEEALQEAGYGARPGSANIGVFVGTGMSSYLTEQLVQGSADLESTQGMALLTATTCAASRIAYLRDLTGPAITIDTACSSSLVAVHMACRALMTGECSMALAGGATVRRFVPRGYHAEEGSIFAPDGHCRPFDRAAQGTVGASGAGVVLLKPLSAALADGDPVHAVIRGTAINNDGGSKAGYTAPSVSGQAAVIRRALAVAQIEPAQIHYIETHGTATALGDQVEIAALGRVFSPESADPGGWTLGTVKANVGHLEAAAGVAGLIKVALALRHRKMPPAIHFHEPLEALGLEKTAFALNTQLRDWPTTSGPRRASVSSFGIGGTNAHAVLQEPASCVAGFSHRASQLLVISSRTEAGLRESCRRLAQRLRADAHLNLADVAYTLQTSRSPQAFRHFVVASDTEEALRNLESDDAPPRWQAKRAGERPPVVFLFPGQGSQYPGMTAGLYESEPVFREQMDLCARLLLPHLGRDVRALLAGPADVLAQTTACQPALFAVEYSLARLWQQWGVTPSMMIGHSLGEYVAACLAGVFTLEDALRVVAARGRLMQGAPLGKMLAVRLKADEAVRCMSAECSLAAVNGPASSVIAGPPAAIDTLRQTLAEADVPCKELAASHAFHSALMDGILEDFARVLQSVRWGEARIPYVSNLSGDIVSPATAASPDYWIRHLRQTVNFWSGLQSTLRGDPKIFLEVGPGSVLGELVRAAPGAAEHTVLASLRGAAEAASDTGGLMRAAGQLWQRGVAINWGAFQAHSRLRRVSLPAAPFERQRHWIDVDRPAEAAQPATLARAPLSEWLHVPVWKQQPRLPLAGVPLNSGASARGCCILIGGGAAVKQALAAGLSAFGLHVVCIAQTDPGSLGSVLHTLDPEDLAPITIVYCAETVGESEATGAPDERRLARGVYGVIDLCQALACEQSRRVALTLLTNGAHAIMAEEIPNPFAAMLAAVAGVISREFPEITCRSVDCPAGVMDAGMIRTLTEEIVAPSSEALTVLRGGTRWARTFERLCPQPGTRDQSLLRPGGVYLVSGGLGGIGWTIAQFLARTWQARLALVGRSPFPERDEWDACLRDRDAEDPLCHRIRAIRALERGGAEVMVLSADVSRPDQMKQVVGRVQSRFGCLNGVVHAAGVAGSGTLFLKTRAAAAQVMAPKVMGTWALYQACRALQPDFFLCCSSLASVLAPAGQYDYCAANAYQDAFCRACEGTSRTRFIAVNWDAWSTVGMAVNTAVPPHLQSQRAMDLLAGISCEEGSEIFCRVLANPLPQWLVSTRGFVSAGLPKEAGASAVNQGPPDRAAAPVGFDPGSSVKSELAGVWKELLGVDARDDEDDFFALGGDSLLAVQLRTRLEKQFHRPVSLRALLREPTLAAMSRLLQETA